MEIKRVKLLEDQVNLVIEYEKDETMLGLIISVENIIRNFDTIQKMKEIGFELL